MNTKQAMSSIIAKYISKIHQQLGPINPNEVIFRGEADAKWEVVSAAGRRLRGTECQKTGRFFGGHRDMELYLEYHKDLIKRTRSIRNYAVDSGKSLTDLEILAKLQHHGGATCLLDFTYNALTALWFAASDLSCDGKVSILNLYSEREDSPKIVEVDETSATKTITQLFSRSNDGSSPVYVYTPTSLSENRVLKQDSVFVFSLFDEYYLKQLLQTVCVVKDDKLLIKEELASLFNIKEETLFYDFTGFASSNHFSKSLNMLEPEFMATIKSREGKIKEAIHYYSRAIQKNKSVFLHARRAELYLVGKAWEDAEKDYSAAISLYKPFPSAELDWDQLLLYSNRAKARYSLKKYEEALADCLKAKEIGADECSFYHMLGDVYNALSRYPEAEENYNICLKYNEGEPVMSTVYRKLAGIAAKRKDSTKYLELMRMAKKAKRERKNNPFRLPIIFSWP